MSTREKAEQWIAQMGGVLEPNDQVIMWCHDDNTPSGKLYDLNRCYCFACHKTFFVPWAKEIKRSKRITPAEYDRYREATGQLDTWPLLKEAVAWLDQDKKQT